MDTGPEVAGALELLKYGINGLCAIGVIYAAWYLYKTRSGGREVQQTNRRYLSLVFGLALLAVVASGMTEYFAYKRAQRCRIERERDARRLTADSVANRQLTRLWQAQQDTVDAVRRSVRALSDAHAIPSSAIAPSALKPHVRVLESLIKPGAP